jgi:hypothetical protein
VVFLLVGKKASEGKRRSHLVFLLVGKMASEGKKKESEVG